MKITLIIILLLIILIYLNFNKCENFDTINDNIDFFVISLKNPDRLQNIEHQNKKLSATININDAFNGMFLNQNELLKSGELSTNFFNDNTIRSKEIGCYKSHFNIYNLINNNPNKKKYSVVLEDDFNIISENIIETIENLLKSLNDLDFDIIFLGNTFSNNSDLVKDDIYNIDKNKFTIGTFAYLINNKNIQKIIENTKIIDVPNLINYSIETKSNIV